MAKSTNIFRCVKIFESQTRKRMKFKLEYRPAAIREIVSTLAPKDVLRTCWGVPGLNCFWGLLAFYMSSFSVACVVFVHFNEEAFVVNIQNF